MHNRISSDRWDGCLSIEGTEPKLGMVQAAGMASQTLGELWLQEVSDVHLSDSAIPFKHGRAPRTVALSIFDAPHPGNMARHIRPALLAFRSTQYSVILLWPQTRQTFPFVRVGS